MFCLQIDCYLHAVNRKLLYISLMAILALICTIGFSQCTSQEKVAVKASYLNHNDTVKYVGSSVCQGCHPDIYESFSKTGMGQSFGEATKQKSSGNFEHTLLYDSFSNLNYRPFWKGDSLFLREFRLENKDTIYKRVEKVDYIVGSGHHTNSHIQNTNGYLHQMPFTYYTQKGVLSLPPGFENGNNSRYRRALGMECVSCHNGLPDHVDGSLNKFEKVPLGIDCERCHGPGEAHVKLKQEGVLVDVSKEIDYSIVNPAKLAYPQQKDLCQRCHLQGNAILKEGKDWKDFKPGMDLTDVYDVFMPRLEDQEGTFIMAAHPDRLRQSACFLESPKLEGIKAMTCITCHNPHQSVKETKMAYFNSKCIDCHKNPVLDNCKIEPNSTECISCHMQKSGTVDIPHVTVTDHYIRVYNEEKQVEKKAENQDFVGLICLTNNKPSNKLKAKAYLNFYEKFDKNKAFLDSAHYYLMKIEKEGSEPEWIQYYFLKGNNEELIKMGNQFLSNNNFGAQTLYQLSTAYGALNELDNNATLLQKAIALEPLRLDLRNELAINYIKQQKLNEAEKQLNFILNEYPKDETANNSMGFLFLVKGNIEQAEKMFDKALRLNPDFEGALLNRSKVELSKNKLEEANTWLERLLKVNPNSKDALLLRKQIQLVLQKG